MESGVDKLTSGSQTELLRIGRAQLFLVDGEETVVLGQGYFALILMVQAQSPLAAMVAQVADVQWPVGKDGPVLKLADYRYSFAIPSLVYGLQFPKDTPKESIQTFESLMQQFCSYEVRSDLAEAAGLSNLRLRYPPTPDDGVQYWSAIADDVEHYSNTLAQQIKKGSSIMAAGGIYKGGEWTSRGINLGAAAARAQNKFSSIAKAAAARDGGRGQERSPRMRYRVDLARRMSAVAKLLSRTVLRGAISSTDHVANLLGSAVSRPARVYLAPNATREVAVASVDAFAKVAEAVETAGKSLAKATISAGTNLVQQRYGEQAGEVTQEGLLAVGEMISSTWTLNKIGMRMVWGATASSIFLNASAKTNTSAFAGHANRDSSSTFTSPETSTQSLLNSQPFPPSSMTRTMSISSQPQMHQLLDDIGNSCAALDVSRNLSSRSSHSDHERESVRETVQLFPGTSDREDDRKFQTAHPQSNNTTYLSTIPPSLLNHHQYMPPQLQQHHPPILPVSMLPPGYVPSYYQPISLNPNSPFQYYARPS